MSTAQKLPLSRSLNRLAQGVVNDAFQKSGQALPCRVVRVVSSNVVTVAFQVNSKFTLPQVTIPMAGAEWIRYPIQPGNGGVVFPADARLAGISNIGGGTADLSQPANLTALVFLPFADAKWSAVDLQAVTIYGPNGVVLRDTGNASNITLTPSGIAITTPEITANVPTTTINGNVTVNGTITASGEVTGNGITLSSHMHGGVQSGGSNTSGPSG
jgi:phage baseplate assembly protein gpV